MVVSAGLPAAQPPTFPGTVSVWRTELAVGDPLRDWTVIWRAEGGLKGPFLLKKDGKTYPVSPEDFWVGIPNEPLYARGLRMPANTPAGTYELTNNGITIAGISIVQSKQNWNARKITPEEFSETAIENWLAGGLDEIIFTPGVYLVKRTLNLPPDKRLTGYGGAKLVRTNMSGEYHNDRMFQASPRLTFVGLGFDTTSLLMHGDRPAPGIVFSECSLYQGALGFWAAADGLLVVGSVFNRASAGQPNGGLWLRCNFHGIGPSGYHAWATNTLTSSCGLVDCIFDGTDRGPQYRGACNAPLCRGLCVRNVGHIDGGNEVLGGEGGAGSFVDRGVFFHHRYYNNEGDITWWDTTVSNSVFVDLAGTDVAFYGGFQNFTNNTLYGFEFRGGMGIQLGLHAKNNVLDQCNVLNYIPRRSNSFGSQPWRYDITGKAVISADGPDAITNTYKDCRVINQLVGVPAFRGLKDVTR